MKQIMRIATGFLLGLLFAGVATNCLGEENGQKKIVEPRSVKKAISYQLDPLRQVGPGPCKGAWPCRSSEKPEKHS